MKTRLIRNYVTTAIGILLLGFCGVMLYTEKSTPAAMSGYITLALLFLRSKDSLISLPKND